MPRSAYPTLLVFVTLCLACAGTSKVTIPSPEPTSKQGDEPPAIKEYTRQQFEQLVKGKTPKQIVEMLGQPSLVHRGSTPVDSDSPQFDGSFYYSRRQLSVDIVDPVAKQTSSVSIYFKQAIVDHVSY
jgi:outer membrane protein assembly factor BamE (lipoprotein component of BamABCDE complex)